MIKDNFKTIVILGVVFLIIFLIIISLSYIEHIKNKNNMENPVLENDNNIVELVNKSSFFTIINCMEHFMNNYKDSNSEIILSLYTDNYVKEHHLNLENVVNNSFLKEKNSLYKISKIYVSDGNQVSTFYICGFVYNDEEKETIYNKVILDYSSGAYGIEFISEKDYYNIVQNNLIPEEKHITLNNYNDFEIATINDISLCALYLSDYKYNIKHNINYAYDNLDNGTKNKYFSSIDDFKKYIDDNYTKIKNSYLSKFQVYNDNNKSNYVCVDNNNITYEFYENSILKYAMSISID